MLARKNHHRHGIAAIYTLVVMTSLIGVTSLAVDVGRVQLVKSQLRHVADAAARYSATSISSGLSAVQTQAAIAASKAEVNGSAITLDPTNDIEIGLWTSGTGTFVPGSTGANAVRITARQTAARGTAVPLYFGAIVGQRSCDVTVQIISTYTAASAGTGFIGISAINLNGSNTIDSYNSALGLYSGSTATNNAYLATNGSPNVNGSFTIHGNFHPGIGNSITHNGTFTVTGSSASLTTALSFAAPTAGSIATVNNNAVIPSTYLSGGNFNMNGSATLTLPAGNYYFNSFSMNGSCSIVCLGAVAIYCNGSFNLNGSVSTSASAPANLKIYNTSGSGVDINGSSTIYAEVYAPSSPVNINGSAQFCGSIIGGQLTLNGSGALHYDTSLGGSSSSATISTVQ